MLFIIWLISIPLSFIIINIIDAYYKAKSGEHILPKDAEDDDILIQSIGASIFWPVVLAVAIIAFSVFGMYKASNYIGANLASKFAKEPSLQMTEGDYRTAPACIDCGSEIQNWKNPDKD